MSYRKQLYKSNTIDGGSNMSEQDLSRKLEVGDLIVGECRCDPSKKGIVEVVGYSPYRNNVFVRFPGGEEIYNSTDERVEWGRTVGAVIGFIEDANIYTKKLHQNYHNWKHIPKSDFTWEVGDVLYGECACTPSKFVVFEVYGRESIKVVDCWDAEEVGRTQHASGCLDTKRGQTLNDYLHKILGVPFRQYNYKKYSKDEWTKRQASKFISLVNLTSNVRFTPGALIEKQEPKEHRFKKSDFKVTETKDEIRVTPRPKYAGGVVSVRRVEGCVPQEVTFKVKEDEVEMFFFDVKTLINKYKDEQ